MAHRGSRWRGFTSRGMSRADDRLPARFQRRLPKHAGLTAAAGQGRHRLLRSSRGGPGDRRAHGETIRALELEPTRPTPGSGRDASTRWPDPCLER